MVKLISMLVILSCSFGYAEEKKEGPCKPKVEARHETRKAMRECLDAWAKDAKPDSTDPSDDCSSKLSAFITAAKDVKACRIEAQKQREQKKAEKQAGKK